MDLHSKRSQVDPGFLADLAAEYGGGEEICDEIRHAETALAVFEIAEKNDLALGDAVAKAAQQKALDEVRNSVAVEIIVYDRSGKLVGRSEF